MNHKFLKYFSFCAWLYFIVITLWFGYRNQLASEIMFAALSICALIVTVGFRLEEIIKENKK